MLRAHICVISCLLQFSKHTVVIYLIYKNKPRSWPDSGNWSSERRTNTFPTRHEECHLRERLCAVGVGELSIFLFTNLPLIDTYRARDREEEIADCRFNRQRSKQLPDVAWNSRMLMTRFHDMYAGPLRDAQFSAQICYTTRYWYRSLRFPRKISALNMDPLVYIDGIKNEMYRPNQAREVV